MFNARIQLTKAGTQDSPTGKSELSYENVFAVTPREGGVLEINKQQESPHQIFLAAGTWYTAEVTDSAALVGAGARR